ncbi:MAG: hypothetical protein R2707_00785 [Acidimicrobiales bacterium]
MTDTPIRLSRHRLDQILTALGAVVVVVLLVAGGLLSWGNRFAEDYVGDELAAQNVVFPSADALSGQGRDDLAKYGDELVDTGDEAEAYASYIKGHVEGIAGGMTYAELSGPERAADAALNEAIANGADADEIAALEEAADEITGQRDSIFRGEMLRGALLNTYAWSTIGRIAGIAAIAAWIAAAAMAVLVAAGVVHTRRHHAAG